MEDDNDPYVVQERARPIAITAAIAPLFKSKYDWDTITERCYSALCEIEFERRLMAPRD